MWGTPWNTHYHWWQKDTNKRDKLNSPLFRRYYGTSGVVIQQGDRVRVHLLGCMGNLFKGPIKEGVMISQDRIMLDSGKELDIDRINRIEKIDVEGVYGSGYRDI